MKKYFLFLVLFAYQQVKAQSLTLQDAVELAKQNSPIAKQIRASYQGDAWRYKANKASLMPQLSLGGTVPGYFRQIGSITQPDGSLLFQNYSRAFSETTLSLQQSILATGGSLRLSSGLERIDIFGNNPSSFWASSPLMLTYQQPLFKINQIKWNWQQQQIQYAQANQQQLEQLEDLSLQVTQKYFDLYISHLQLRNAEYNLSINDTIYTISKGRFGLGKIAENELLQVELGLMNARNSVEQNKLRVSVNEKQLRNLIGLQEGSSVAIVAPLAAPNIDPDPMKAIQEAHTNRSDFKGFELAENRAQMNLRSAQISRRFSADLNVSVGFNQTAPNLGDAFRNLQGSQAAFLGFTIPIANAGRNKANYEAAKNDLEATQQQINYGKNALEIEVYNAVLELKQQKASLQISAKADTIARKRYEVSKNRYLIGKIDITNLIIAQNEKDQALVSYMQALQSYWLAYYRLRRLSLYDFETNQKIAP
ncbi:MAG: TolC family protein [Spirosomataceae bacterium]